MELVLEINVTLTGHYSVQGKNRQIVMLPFTGEAVGPLFTGKVAGSAADTQTITENSFALSARYMLEGEDHAGQKCRIFVENNGSSLENLTPVITTDSKALSYLEDAALKSIVTPVDGGVIVRIYRL